MRISNNESIGDVIKNLDGFVGDFLGRGVGRRVYRWNMRMCRTGNLDMVVKFATNSCGIQSNFTEAKFWDFCPEDLKKYFCLVYGVSADYKVLLMQRAVVDNPSLSLPREVHDKLSKFFTGDFGAGNLGMVNGDLKIIDYGFIDFQKLIKNTIK